MKNKKDKFRPAACGLLKRKDKDGETEYLYLKGDKIVGRLWHVNYFMGLPIEWEAFRIVQCVDNDTKQHCVFQGRIPTNAFGRQLIKNLFYSE